MARQRVQKERSSHAGQSFRRGQEVHDDSRTQRERTRSDAERAALTEEMDAILEEIDEVLEENAEEFVKGYVQKGGQ